MTAHRYLLLKCEVVKMSKAEQLLAMATTAFIRLVRLRGDRAMDGEKNLNDKYKNEIGEGLRMSAMSDRLVEAIKDAMNNIGVPQPGYPAPISEAYMILQRALTDHLRAAATPAAKENGEDDCITPGCGTNPCTDCNKYIHNIPAAPEGGEKCTCQKRPNGKIIRFDPECPRCFAPSPSLPAKEERRALGDDEYTDPSKGDYIETPGNWTRPVGSRWIVGDRPNKETTVYRPAPQPAAQSAEPNLTVDLTAILPDMPESKYVLMARYVATLDVVKMCRDVLDGVIHNLWSMTDAEAALVAAEAILKREEA
jgi:hypothetical protein